MARVVYRGPLPISHVCKWNTLAVSEAKLLRAFEMNEEVVSSQLVEVQGRLRASSSPEEAGVLVPSRSIS